MHEVSLAQSIVSIAEKSIPPESAPKKITSVTIDVGKLSGIEIEALKFAFSFVKENTALKDAELIINNISAAAICNECGKKFELNQFATPCPVCGSFSLNIIRGKELKVIQIEIDD